MVDAQTRVNCPACAHQLVLTPSADLHHLVCPHCEAQIPADAVRGETEIAEEIAPGFRPGQKIGNYAIESLIGTGGMAVVFKARQLSLNRPVALKVLPKNLAKNKMFVQRFGSEAAALASLNHANVVSVIDRGCEEDTYYIVMEYIEGDTLKHRLDEQGRLAPQEIYPIARQILAGLGYAHRRSVVHRDIKPGNVIINTEGDIKIADFGLAHLAKQEGGFDQTRENQTMGTLKYMAPEQLSGAKYVDGRADLYSFGVCLYEMLTGKLPVGTFKMPSEFDNALDIRWDDIIFRVLKTEPEERYADAAELVKAIEEIANTPEVTIDEKDLEELAEEEEAKKAKIPLAACANCGHVSSPTSQVCENCKTRLDDIFDHCPKCKAVSRVDVVTCPKCGTNLGVYRTKLRRAAETIQTKAAKLIAAKRYDLALGELTRLLKFRTREYASVRESARIWIERVKAKAERYRQRIYEAGRRMMAEGRYEAAVKTWAPLPDTYKEVAKYRDEVATRREEARMALADGNRLYKSHDIAGAVSAWKKAAAFWPNNEELRKCLAKAKIQLGNYNLKQTCLQEARAAEDRGDYDEAISQCRHMLELDPDDATTLGLLDELILREREQADSGGINESRLIAPHILAPPPPRRVFSKVIATFIILALVAGGVFAYIRIYKPYSEKTRHLSAGRLLSQIEHYRSLGNFDLAISEGERLLIEFPEAEQAEKASKHVEEMKAMMEAAKAACAEVDVLALRKGTENLEAAYVQYGEIIASPPVSKIEDYRTYATKQRAKIRDRVIAAIVAEAAEYELKGDWRSALAQYERAVEEYQASSVDIRNSLARAREHAEGSAALLDQARTAMADEQWDRAAAACASALDRAPADREANELLRNIVESMPVPEGMVLIPPGEYRIGGSDGNPERTVTVAHGFFVDQTEVTHERYAEFLRSTGRRAPNGWGMGVTPPPGSEQLPVVNVTWEDAQAFAEWAGCTLPTQSDWECAARGRAGRAYSWGDQWNANAAVLGFGPAPVSAARDDQGIHGGMDMVGNVAEWTATHVAQTEPNSAQPHRPMSGRGATASRRGPMRYVVKGSSWVGREKGRPTMLVSDQGLRAEGRSMLGSAEAGLGLVITPDPQAQEVLADHLANIELLYLGQFATAEAARVMVRRWLPEWRTWAEFAFPVKVDGEELIGEVQTLRAASASGDVSLQVDFSTGCVAVGQEPKEWLDVRFPDGVTRRLPYAGAIRAQSLTLPANRAEPLESALDIRDTARCASWMPGVAQSRYVNVGFRCVKRLWTAPEPKALPATDVALEDESTSK